MPSVAIVFITVMAVSALKAVYAIRDGLNDPLVRTGHRLSLHQRATRMKESASCKKYRLLLRDLASVSVPDVTHVNMPFLLERCFMDRN